jgi:hypothetical protein
MMLNFETPEVLKASITTYMKKIIDKSPPKMSSKTRCPWNKNLFKVDNTSSKFNKTKNLSTFVMKGMFLCKHA